MQIVRRTKDMGVGDVWWWWWCFVFLVGFPIAHRVAGSSHWTQTSQVTKGADQVFYPLPASSLTPTPDIASPPPLPETSRDKGDHPDEVLTYYITAPAIFGEDGEGEEGGRIRVEVTPAEELLAPGLVVQRVSGNMSWVGEVGEMRQCLYTGHVTGHPRSTLVSLSLCGDGMRGIIQTKRGRYFIEPVKNTSLSSSSSSSLLSSSSSSSSSVPLHQRPHIIYQQQQSSSGEKYSAFNCSVTENFKHGRLKPSQRRRSSSATTTQTGKDNSSLPIFAAGRSFADEGVGRRQRRKRSPGVSRKYRVETLVVADNHMLDYHGTDVEQYVLTLMSVVRNVYRDASLRNYINIVVVKFLIFQTEEDMPFNVSNNAAATLREFCLWQHRQNDHDHTSPQHHDTAILITRKDLCRAPGKCDTLGLAELGTICDPLRSCSIIQDNGLSSAFTIAHELGHVFNLPHDDDDNQCKDHQTKGRKGRARRRYHVMAPTLDSHSYPWDWSTCSAALMTEFIDAGLAGCLRDTVKVMTWNNKVKKFSRPGWLYSADQQCEFVFGPGYGLCPYMNYPTCERLWCTNKTDSPSSGCRTQHMPWADGTLCAEDKYCLRGKCVSIPSQELRPTHGGWGPWSKFDTCSRTCGGGVKKRERHCDSPEPKNGGRFCLGRRVKYKSCNTHHCPANSEDFRAEQCAQFNGKVDVNGFSPNTKWVPKYSGIELKDACRLYCRASHSTSYSLLAKKVVDGTKCQPFSDDICVNGQCWRAGCDNKLGSKMKRDRCGVCGGDNYSCRSVTGVFNNAIYGYNHVTTIPAGATQLDIRQYGQDHYQFDDNYLALKDWEKKFILNGDFIVRTERWKVKVKGAILEYSGSDHTVEHINSTHMLGEPVNVFVLSVGQLVPPNVTFSYIISAGDSVRFSWSNKGPWRKCSQLCRGQRKRRILCVREGDNLIVSEKRCKGKKKPPRIVEPCNTDCFIEWRVFSQEECPVRCGVGLRRQLVHCIKQTGYSQVQIIRDRECRRHLGAKPDEHVQCTGPCLPTFWSYTRWSQCTVSCGGGTRERRARCVDEEGQELPDSECDVSSKVTSLKCNTQPCPAWVTGDWIGCSVTCGGGRKQRKVWCMVGEKKVPDAHCDKKYRPAAKKPCNTKDCPRWVPGGWGPCSASCDKGLSVRSLKCRLRYTLQDDSVCDASKRPHHRKACYLRPCPTTTTTTPVPTTTKTTSTTTTTTPTTSKPTSTTTTAVPTSTTTTTTVSTSTTTTTTARSSRASIPVVAATKRPVTESALANAIPTSRAAFWRFGSWTECSATCGQGTKHRFVSCMGYYGKALTSAHCAHLERPASVQACMIAPCGDWHSSNWSDCTVSCGEGVQTRFVECMFNEQIADDSFCDTVIKPDTEIRCNRGTCISPSEHDFKTGIITSNRVEGTSRWLTWEWGPCSVTCGAGWRRRHVVCYDEMGPSDSCELSLKPDEFQGCHTAPCPAWVAAEWSECSAKTCREEGLQNRVVQCQTGPEDVLPSQHCRHLPRPPDTRQCQAPCPSSSLHRWKAGTWSSCSVTCGRGQQQREIMCLDRGGNSVSYALCKGRKPRNTKRCAAGQCPKWKKGRWSRCSATCGEGVKTREVVCRNMEKVVVSPALCPALSRPKTERPCQRKACSLFVWNVGQWSECSKTCGFGRKHRPVTCQDRQGQQVTSHLCDVNTKPKTRRRCSEFPCPYIWNPGPWTPCSATCGEGQQSRAVTCQAVTKEGWMLPGSVEDGCHPQLQPPATRACNYGPCGTPYRWTVGDWGECSAKCGQGREQRRVTCMDGENQRVPSSRCLRRYRPSRRRSCYNGPCYARSCKELKELTTIRKDGDYQILVDNQLVTIYCKDMRKSTPVEYLSLPSGESENFAEVYSERLRRHATCPYNGTRAEKCDLCRVKKYRQAGNTTYTKVRIDLHTLRLFANDRAFSRVHSGKFVPFATAGDCYSSASCPQGQFSVNLAGTGFIVSINTTWMLQGNEATQQIWRLRDGQIIRGLCGGYCGVCSPDHLTGLQLQLVT